MFELGDTFIFQVVMLVDIVDIVVFSTISTCKVFFNRLVIFTLKVLVFFIFASYDRMLCVFLL